ncbi:hypothetical protein BGW36DRAFT_365705 [Talaromyces proteolyticus]|uniref:Uncharacterized protein n=1 Tax=Talaromyces proteolyticus TaxID=1131652 RepID=A0AAD4KEU2_9EURO|nr:uncharacterized protein BGW36DRAFT_365705 [Talaromyces proteolyticus]KAH8689173.1 hypothetical protein BGW36DRAFT_365705 [Talaromyces proteolyticus]
MGLTLNALFLILWSSLTRADNWVYPPGPSIKWTDTWYLGEIQQLEWISNNAAYNIVLQQNEVNIGNGRYQLFGKFNTNSFAFNGGSSIANFDQLSQQINSKSQP